MKLTWEPGFKIEVKNGNEVYILANAAGLRSLATQFLTLAQDEVPNGTHIHLDSYNSLEEGSAELIIVKK